MEKENDEKSLVQENLGAKKEIKELKESLDSLEESIRTTNSTKKVIWRAVITGLGGVIGATIIFGILLTLISWILYSTGIFPGLNEFLNNLRK